MSLLQTSKKISDAGWADKLEHITSPLTFLGSRPVHKLLSCPFRVLLFFFFFLYFLIIINIFIFFLLLIPNNISKRYFQFPFTLQFLKCIVQQIFVGSRGKERRGLAAATKWVVNHGARVSFALNIPWGFLFNVSFQHSSFSFPI